jgi:hypothetical protein
LPDQRVRLVGRSFGTACASCEVIANYAQGLRYALPIDAWQDDEITVQLPDFGRGDSVTVSVKTSSGTSQAQSTTLARKISSTTIERASDLKVGNRDEEHIDVSAPAPACGQRAWLFERAQLMHVRQRFGEAQITSQPNSGCSACAPLTVRWYHEPTGHLQFRVTITRREVAGLCRERVR